MHYTCDLFFALSWAAITGLHSPFPWFYPLFFACMITHRAVRDIQRCRAKYGSAWTEYERRVPYLFMPVSFKNIPLLLLLLLLLRLRLRLKGLGHFSRLWLYDHFSVVDYAASKWG
jgi:Ergosterol biosynthesis ERG4/ERG24 family